MEPEPLIIDDTHFSPIEQKVMLIVKLAEDIGICPGFSHPGHAHFKETARGLVQRDFLYRCYDSEERDRPDNRDDMDFAFTPQGRLLAEELYDWYGGDLKTNEAIRAWINEGRDPMEDWDGPHI